MTILTISQFAFNISTAALTVFLKLCKQLLLYFSRTFDCHQLAKFRNVVPLTIKSLHQMILLKTNCFESYVVCTSCDSIYMFEDCVESTVMGNLKESKKCRHAYFPNHPHVSQRAPCGSLLLNVKGHSGYYTTQSVSIQATTTINQTSSKESGFYTEV